MKGTFPRPGEITIHLYKNGDPSGAIILRCPFCNGLQHLHATIEGPDSAPTVPKPLKCGCVKCGESFRIRSGYATREKQGDGPPKVELSKKMKEAGVFYTSERGWKK